MSNDFYVGYYEDHYLAHHGILGQKWGVRRYQNPDGSLTDAGYKRYGKKHLDASMKQDIRTKKQIDSKHTAAATGVAGIGGATLALATGGSLPLSLLATAGTTAAVSSVLHRISTAKLKSNYAEMIAERKKGEDKINKMLEKLNTDEEKNKMNSFVRDDKKEIASSVAKELTADIKRWQKEGEAQIPSSLKNMSDSEIEKVISKKIEKKVADSDKETTFRNRDGTIEFVIDGIPEYSDGAPLTVCYNPNNKKLKFLTYT